MPKSTLCSDFESPASLHLHTLIYDVFTHLQDHTASYPVGLSVCLSFSSIIFLLTCLLPCLPALGLLLFITTTLSPFLSPPICLPQSLLSIAYPQGSLMNKPCPALLGSSPDDAHNWQNVAIVTFLSCADTTVSPENISFPIFTFPKSNFTAKFRQSPLLQLLANYLFR